MYWEDMMLNRLLLAIALVTGVVTTPAAAQTYPTRPITMIVPYPAGGVTDGLARLIAEHMKGSLGQTVIVENVGGAGGSIGAGRVARAAPDGYTILLGNAETHVFNPAAQTLQFDVVKDFEPVALMPRYPFILVTSNDVAGQDPQGADRLDQGQSRQGVAGDGRRRYRAASLRPVDAGHRSACVGNIVPYRGGAPAMQDLLAGQINFMCTASGSFLPLIRNGQIRAYAVTTKARIDGAPDIPTVDEAGHAGAACVGVERLLCPQGHADGTRSTASMPPPMLRLPTQRSCGV